MKHLAVLTTTGLLALGCGEDDRQRPTCTIYTCVDSGVDGDADTDSDSDTDGDGDADPCDDRDGDGYVPLGCPDGDDCIEGNPDVHPGGSEVCNGMDDDCNGQVDDGLLAHGTDVALPTNAMTVRGLSMAATVDSIGVLTLEASDYKFDDSVYLTELDASGLPLGPAVLVSDSALYWDAPAIALGASQDAWFAAWADVADRDPANANNGHLAVARITGSDVQEAIADPELDIDAPAVAVGSTTVAIVYHKEGGDVTTHYVVLSQDDLTLVGGDSLSQDNYVGAWRPAIVWTGSGYLAAWTQRDQVVVATIDEAGAAAIVNYVEALEPLSPILAWGDFGGALVWGDMFGTGTWFRSLDSSGLTGQTEVTLGAGKLPRIAPGPGSFALAGLGPAEIAEQQGPLMFSMLDLAGGVSNEMNPDDAASPNARDVAVVPTSGGWAVAWVTRSDWTAHFDRVTCPQ